MTLQKPIASVCHVTPCCEHIIFTVVFFLICVILFAMDDKNQSKCLRQFLHEAR
jgi:hypothetical protein